VSLVAELTALQEARGYLADEDLTALAERRKVPLYRLEGLVTFYPHFRRTPPPRTELALCRDASCALRGAASAAVAVREALAAEPDIAVHEVSCLGRCEIAPAAAVNGHPTCALPTEDLCAAARAPEGMPSDEPRASPSQRWSADVYAGGDTEPYALLRELRALPEQAAAARVLGTLDAAGLRGLGGAGFPTGKKWALVRAEPARPHHVICNADESEPGTFKDRVVLEEMPHLVVEAMAIAGLVAGATHATVYIRHEYGKEHRALERALGRARDLGVLGPAGAANPAGFDADVFVSPGGYILGEETALLEAMEDRRGEPRNKPPFPGTHGLRGLPTLINNVETFAWVPAILRRGAEWWKSQGVRGAAGLKLIAVSGHVERPGVYEVPMGTSVAELIALAGGVLGGRPLLAFAPGGASSNFLPAAEAGVALDFAALQKAGSMLGSGALLVVAEGTDLLGLATNVTRFFRNESCGKCVPCRVGSHKGVELLESLAAGKGGPADVALLEELNETLALTSICGLGQVALGPALSVLRRFPQTVRRAPPAGGAP
jgi:NADH:ubiquinone oxidoreductase subunit F (NADH-binding)/NADH:ubiquinone oxidoreductase subunit E